MIEGICRVYYLTHLIANPCTSRIVFVYSNDVIRLQQPVSSDHDIPASTLSRTQMNEIVIESSVFLFPFPSLQLLGAGGFVCLSGIDSCEGAGKQSFQKLHDWRTVFFSVHQNGCPVYRFTAVSTCPAPNWTLARSYRLTLIDYCCGATSVASTGRETQLLLDLNYYH